ncbi:MAG: lipocalin family protein [Calditrichaceae bacterium]|jgi:hypothetical protein
MNNQKFIFIVLIVILTEILFITHCSDSTSNSEGTLEGKWLLTKVTTTTPLGSYSENPAEEGYTVRLTINNDNTYTVVEADESGSEVTNGTWSKSGNTLTIVDGDDVREVEYDLDGDKLRISFEEEYQGVTGTITQEFTRQ